MDEYKDPYSIKASNKDPIDFIRHIKKSYNKSSTPTKFKKIPIKVEVNNQRWIFRINKIISFIKGLVRASSKVL